MSSRYLLALEQALTSTTDTRSAQGAGQERPREDVEAFDRLQHTEAAAKIDVYEIAGRHGLVGLDMYAYVFLFFVESSYQDLFLSKTARGVR